MIIPQDMFLSLPPIKADNGCQFKKEKYPIEDLRHDLSPEQ